MDTGGRKPPSTTQRFDSARLAESTRAAVDPVAPIPVVDDQAVKAVGTKPPEVARSRTSTVHDPMTMALLAEVERTSRTDDSDVDPLEAAVDDAVAEQGAPPPPAPHPHVKRR